jgi:predicted  nucleic acid-binding Zn-ribbon protein
MRDPQPEIDALKKKLDAAEYRGRELRLEVFGLKRQLDDLKTTISRARGHISTIRLAAQGAQQERDLDGNAYNLAVLRQVAVDAEEWLLTVELSLSQASSTKH